MRLQAGQAPPGTITLAAVAVQLGVCERTLERRMTESVATECAR